MDPKFALDVWIALVLGMAVQWVARGFFVVNEAPEHTAGGFVERHWKKQVTRMGVTLVLVYYIVPADWFPASGPAFMFSLGSDKLLEDLFDLARKGTRKIGGTDAPKP